MLHSDDASWSDAEDMCKQSQGHLWSINSHDEWWDVYHSLATSVVNPETQQDMNIQLINTAFTVILFFGLQRQSASIAQVLLTIRDGLRILISTYFFSNSNILVKICSSVMSATCY